MSAERLSQLRADPSTGEPANDTESRRHAGMGRIHAHPGTVTRRATASDLGAALLRLLPAGAVAGWDLHPLESAALSRRTPEADAQHLPTNIAESTALVG
jgi:hypothetical protein